MPCMAGWLHPINLVLMHFIRHSKLDVVDTSRLGVDQCELEYDRHSKVWGASADSRTDVD